MHAGGVLGTRHDALSVQGVDERAHEERVAARPRQEPRGEPLGEHLVVGLVGAASGGVWRTTDGRP